MLAELFYAIRPVCGNQSILSECVTELLKDSQDPVWVRMSAVTAALKAGIYEQFIPKQFILKMYV